MAAVAAPVGRVEESTSTLAPKTFRPVGALPHGEPDAPTMEPPERTIPLKLADPGAAEPVAPTDGFEPPPPPPPFPPAPVGRPEPPDIFSDVAPAVSIAAINVFGPTVNAIHPPAGTTSFAVVAVTVEVPSVTKAGFEPVL